MDSLGTRMTSKSIMLEMDQISRTFWKYFLMMDAEPYEDLISLENFKIPEESLGFLLEQQQQTIHEQEACYDNDFMMMRNQMEIMRKSINEDIKEAISLIEDVKKENEETISLIKDIKKENEETISLIKDIKKENEETISLVKDIKKENEEAISLVKDIKKENEETISLVKDIKKENEEAISLIKDAKKENEDIMKANEEFVQNKINAAVLKMENYAEQMAEKVVKEFQETQNSEIALLRNDIASLLSAMNNLSLPASIANDSSSFIAAAPTSNDDIKALEEKVFKLEIENEELRLKLSTNEQSILAIMDQPSYMNEVRAVFEGAKIQEEKSFETPLIPRRSSTTMTLSNASSLKRVSQLVDQKTLFKTPLVQRAPLNEIKEKEVNKKAIESKIQFMSRIWKIFYLLAFVSGFLLVFYS